MLAWIIFGVMWTAGPTAARPVQPGDTTRVAAGLKAMLSQGRHPAIRWPDLSDVHAVAESAYRRSNWHPLWIEAGRATAPALAVIEAIRAVADRGLAPADYDADSLAAAAARLAQGDGGESEQAWFDLALTTAVIRVASTLHEGRLDRGALAPGWRTGPSRLDLIATLDTLRRSGGPRSVLDRLEPQEAAYRQLKKWLAHYRTLAGAPASLVPVTKPPSPGGQYPEASHLRRTLMIVGDLDTGPPPPAGADTLFDDALRAAVQRFQRRHGLRDDGVIGPATLAQLNQPFEQRVRQIAIALERRRWWPDSARTPPIIVNVPAFRLTATGVIDGRDTVIAMNIIAGVAHRDETPIFTGDLGRVVFQPFWEVPVSIMRKEIRPKAVRNPAYLEREGMDLLEGEHIVAPTRQNVSRIGHGVRVRQRPGPRNPLGRVKFLLTSGYAIHLHDTPAASLFEPTRRDFSHGCIRVSAPSALARFVLLRLPGWTSQRIDAAMAADTSVAVELPDPIGVAVGYEPVVPSDHGIEFRPDVYGGDRTLARLLAAGYPYRKRIP